MYNEVESSKKWATGMVPFAGDAVNGLLVINSSSGEVVEWDRKEGLVDSVAASFSSFLESYRDELLGGRMEFLDDSSGVVEKMTKARK